MNNGFLEKISEENIKHIEKYIELQLQDKKFEAAQYIKNQFEKKRPLDTFNTSFEFNYLNSNDNVEEFKEELRETVKTGKSQKKPIFEKYSIITPRFSPPDGWNWDNDKRTDIAKENILFKTNKNHSKPAMICWKKTNGIMKEALLQYTLVDVKTGASLSKEGEFPIDIYKEQEVEKKLEFISYRNCDLRDLRTLKIFERALNALHITIDLKENYQDGLEVHPTLRRQIEKNMEKLIQVTQTSESSRR